MHINYHTLSDFRGENADKLDELLTNIISVLIAQGLVKIDSVLLDGTKIKANAGKKSFKTRGKLTKLKRQTRTYVNALRQETSQRQAVSEKRYEAARKRALTELDAKVDAALAELPKLEAVKEAAKSKVKKGSRISEAKVSTTDAQARFMRFHDNSVKAGYNCQLVIDPQSYVVLAANVSQQGNDKGLLKPMIEEIDSRYGVRPARALVDSGYPTQNDIVALAGHKPSPTLVYSPIGKEKEPIKKASLDKRQKRKASYPELYKQFIRRMENKIAQRYYKLRSRIETCNGIFHNRLPYGFRLRGTLKVKAELLLQAIAHNILSWHRIAGTA